MKFNKKRFTLSLSKGFTLIELLIVITIIGILTALISTNLQGARSRARDTRRKADLRTIEQSIRLYYNDAKRFPASDDGQIVGCNTIVSPTTCAWGAPFATDTSTYIGSLPQDPSRTLSNPSTYIYLSNSSDEYMLLAQLENLSDAEIAESQARCSTIYNTYTGQDETKDFVICAQ